MDQCSDDVYSNQAICKNQLCKAILPADGVRCGRCTCYICGQYDEIKDPSRWMVCELDNPQDCCCGQTCHMECAFKEGNLGVVTLKNFMPLDGSYWCTKCGKVSDILGYWKKQISIAKDTCSVSILCDSISLSHRLLDDTKRFKALHEALKSVKSELEGALDPTERLRSKTKGTGIKKLSIARDVQSRCGDLLEVADKWPQSPSNLPPTSEVGPYRPACRILFHEVGSSSIVIVLIDTPAAMTDRVKHYSLWCWRIGKEDRQIAPNQTFFTSLRRVTISNLQPSVVYGFRIISYTKIGQLGVSEAKCSTRNPDLCADMKLSSETTRDVDKSPLDIGVIIPLAPTEQTGCLRDQFPSDGIDDHHGQPDTPKSQAAEHVQTHPSPDAFLLPDLNEDATSPFQQSQEDETRSVELAICDDASQNLYGDDKDASQNLYGDDKDVSQDIQMNVQENDISEKSSATNKDIHPPPQMRLDKDDFLNCIKIVRWLELNGHIQRLFRIKFLTWFSLRSNETQKMAAYGFVATLSHDPSMLAEQLVDAFSSEMP